MSSKQSSAKGLGVSKPTTPSNESSSNALDRAPIPKPAPPAWMAEKIAKLKEVEDDISAVLSYQDRLSKEASNRIVR